MCFSIFNTHIPPVKIHALFLNQHFGFQIQSDPRRDDNVKPYTLHPQYLHPGRVSPLPRYSTWLRLP